MPGLIILCIWMGWTFPMSDDIKQELLQSMSKDPEVSMRLANRFRQQGREVPESILKSLGNSTMGGSFSRIIAQTYVSKKESIPDVLIQRIAQNGKDSYYLAKYCLDHNYPIHPAIYDAVKETKFIVPLKTMMDKKFKNEEDEEGDQKPEIYKELLAGILKDSNKTLKYVELLLKNNRPIPDNIEKAFENDPGDAVKYAMTLLENGMQPSERIIDIIAKDPYSSFAYAQGIFEMESRPKFPPLKIIESLAQIVEQSANYGRKLLTRKIVKPEIFKILEKGIVKGTGEELRGYTGKVTKSDYAGYYAIPYVSATGELPSKPVMDLVSKNPKSLVMISNNLWTRGKEVPEDIVDKISKSPAAAFSFKVRYTNLKNKPLPPIYKKIDVAADKYDKEHI